jgi:hypothetical protein
MASIVLVGGIVGTVNHILGFIAVVTAAGASVARYGIILTDADRRRIERSTAYGFHFGILLALGLFVLDQTVG